MITFFQLTFAGIIIMMLFDIFWLSEYIFNKSFHRVVYNRILKFNDKGFFGRSHSIALWTYILCPPIWIAAYLLNTY